MINLDELEAKARAALDAKLSKDPYYFESEGWFNFESDLQPEVVIALIAAMRVYREALLVQTKHDGYCDGPLGCGCSAPKARKALAEADKILGGEIASKQLKQVPDGEIYMTDAGPVLVMMHAEAFQALRPGDRVGFKLGKIK